MDTVTLTNNHLTVRIRALGAEMQSVLDRNGIERLWHGDAAYWSGRAPVLFPIAGGLKEDTYYLRDKRYMLSKHGFALKRVFALESLNGTSATFLLTGDTAYDEGFPFRYTFRVCYTLEDDAIRIAYRTENLDNEPFCCSAGAHEAYACPEGIDGYEVVFDQTETFERGLLSGNLLTRQTEIMQPSGTVLELKERLFANDALVFPTVKSRKVTLRSPHHGRTVDIAFDGFDYLLLWTKPGAPYICIEPWQNLPDYEDTDQDITQKPGMVQLMPGAASELIHTLTFR